MDNKQTNLEIEKLKIEKHGISSFIEKFISVLLTIITGCVMTMVGFIWNLKSEFAEEKKEREYMQRNLEDMKSEIIKSGQSIGDMRERLIRVEEKTKNIEQKVDK